MSKKNSWGFIEGRCELVFGTSTEGKSRFFKDDQTLHITFDHDDPIQRHEHDTLISGMKKKGVRYASHTMVHKPKDSPIIIPDSNILRITIRKSEVDEDVFNDCLLPIATYSQIKADGSRNYHSTKDARLRYLNALTEVPWVEKLPTPYTKDTVFMPLESDRNLSDEQREEQSIIIAEASMPQNRLPALKAREWVDQQRVIEKENGLPVTTALSRDFMPEDQDARAYRWDKTFSGSFIDRVRKVFKPQQRS